MTRGTDTFSWPAGLSDDQINWCSNMNEVISAIALRSYLQCTKHRFDPNGSSVFQFELANRKALDRG